MIPALVTIIALYAGWRILDRSSDPAAPGVVRVSGFVALLAIALLTGYVWAQARQAGEAIDAARVQMEELMRAP